MQRSAPPPAREVPPDLRLGLAARRDLPPVPGSRPGPEVHGPGPGLYLDSAATGVPPRLPDPRAPERVTIRGQQYRRTQVQERIQGRRSFNPETWDVFRPRTGGELRRDILLDAVGGTGTVRRWPRNQWLEQQWQGTVPFTALVDPNPDVARRQLEGLRRDLRPHVERFAEIVGDRIRRNEERMGVRFRSAGYSRAVPQTVATPLELAAAHAEAAELWRNLPGYLERKVGRPLTPFERDAMQAVQAYHALETINHPRLAEQMGNDAWANLTAEVLGSLFGGPVAGRVLRAGRKGAGGIGHGARRLLPGMSDEAAAFLARMERTTPGQVLGRASERLAGAEAARNLPGLIAEGVIAGGIQEPITRKQVDPETDAARLVEAAVAGAIAGGLLAPGSRLSAAALKSLARRVKARITRGEPGAQAAQEELEEALRGSGTPDEGSTVSRSSATGGPAEQGPVGEGTPVPGESPAEAGPGGTSGGPAPRGVPQRANSPYYAAGMAEGTLLKMGSIPGGASAQIPLEKANELHARLLEELGYDANTRRFRILDEMGVPYQVANPHGIGTWPEGGATHADPHIVFEFESEEEARHWAPGFAAATRQKSVGLEFPEFASPNVSGLKLTKPGGVPFTLDEFTYIQQQLAALELGPELAGRNNDVLTVYLYDRGDEQTFSKVSQALADAMHHLGFGGKEELSVFQGSTEEIEPGAGIGDSGRIGDQGVPGASRRPHLPDWTQTPLALAHERVYGEYYQRPDSPGVAGGSRGVEPPSVPQAPPGSASPPAAEPPADSGPPARPTKREPPDPRSAAIAPAPRLRGAGAPERIARTVQVQGLDRARRVVRAARDHGLTVDVQRLPGNRYLVQAFRAVLTTHPPAWTA